ncbi:hypothetical protein [Vagococcus hydrophili]|uniref:Uncharacterized protein n=1 Tax=Vagococcus hydrophili TaxID=2714947 RepID=A0A6G8ASM0_9ENTE|nr:hypothetical protein [Vagococcus hydrophili]QIL48071.1 hypothetical protein G7082_05875 [Vagococcus hydrophili]
MRNAATHSRPLISNVVEPFQYGKKKNSLKYKKSAIQLTQFAERAGIDSELRNKALTNMKVNDIVATIYLHERYVKHKGLKNRNAQELKNLLQVIKRNKQMYAKNHELREIYYFFELIIAEYTR